MIVTGFPILAAAIGENDGPAGAAVIADALYKLGKKVTIITDIFSEELVKSSLKVLKTPIDVICSPLEGSTEFLIKLQREKTPDTIITIERPSKGSDGLFHSMRGTDISSMVSDTDILLKSEVTTISIGDGGNECGMGCFYDEICLYVPCGKVIAANTRCDYPLVAGISNYYGWGIAAALSLISRRELLSDELVQIAVIDAISQSGGVDGTKGIISSSVDGQPLEDYIEVYRSISNYLP